MNTWIRGIFSRSCKHLKGTARRRKFSRQDAVSEHLEDRTLLTVTISEVPGLPFLKYDDGSNLLDPVTPGIDNGVEGDSRVFELGFRAQVSWDPGPPDEETDGTGTFFRGYLNYEVLYQGNVVYESFVANGYSGGADFRQFQTDNAIDPGITLALLYENGRQRPSPIDFEVRLVQRQMKCAA